MSEVKVPISKAYAVINKDGDIVSTGTTDRELESLSRFIVPEGCLAIEISEPRMAHQVYWDGSSIRDVPPDPGGNHVFNRKTGNWELDLELAWEAVRQRRTQLFAQTEWVRSRSMDQGVPVPQDWIDYWQALRDITNKSDPLKIKWPLQPAA